jgi:DUF1365 family protein
VRHAFTYPIFLFCANLEEVEEEKIFSDVLWPLSLICRLHTTTDHLKNGEGLVEGKEEQTLQERVYRLVSEKTKEALNPSPETHRCVLMTHLTYYGYCFNPVSFYYLINKESDKVDCVVGEVSNTPWLEQHCYVLHTQSIDQVQLVKENDSRADDDDDDDDFPAIRRLHYVFPKRFHVSPFMEMTYNYDWTFQLPTNSFSSEESPGSTIRVVNRLRQQAAGRGVQFSAVMTLQRRSLHPFRIAYHLALFPMFCLIIQIWIHYQAAWLLVKGVTFQPHPAGAETTASRIIGGVMTPYFVVQDWWQKKTSSSRKED